MYESISDLLFSIPDENSIKQIVSYYCKNGSNEK
jgi:hypothetical protein